MVERLPRRFGSRNDTVKTVMKNRNSFENQRVGIFIDVQNLYHSAKNLYHGRVNYPELIRHLVGDRQLIRAMAYVVKSDGPDVKG